MKSSAAIVPPRESVALRLATSIAVNESNGYNLRECLTFCLRDVCHPFESRRTPEIAITRCDIEVSSDHKRGPLSSKDPELSFELSQPRELVAIVRIIESSTIRDVNAQDTQPKSDR
jgi:hypothetical protein